MKTFLSITALGAMACMAFKDHKTVTAPIPQYKHVIVVVEENHNYDALIGSPNSPYISWLSQNCALFTDSHGVTHQSQPNYLAIFSGSVQGIVDDKCLMMWIMKGSWKKRNES